MVEEGEREWKSESERGKEKETEKQGEKVRGLTGYLCA